MVFFDYGRIISYTTFSPVMFNFNTSQTIYLSVKPDITVQEGEMLHVDAKS